MEDISAALSNLAGPLPLHGCDDGGYGVVDLLGARPLDVARLDEEGALGAVPEAPSADSKPNVAEPDAQTMLCAMFRVLGEFGGRLGRNPALAEAEIRATYERLTGGEVPAVDGDGIGTALAEQLRRHLRAAANAWHSAKGC